MGVWDDPTVSRIREIAEASARGHFLELFELKTHLQGKNLVLTVVIDKKSGPVTLEECAAVSRDLSNRLDEADFLQTPYLLQVASPGLDRPLRSLEDFQRFKGRMAHIVLTEPLEGVWDFRGSLGEVQGDQVELLTEGGRVFRAPFSLLKRANLVVET